MAYSDTTLASRDHTLTGGESNPRVILIIAHQQIIESSVLLTHLAAARWRAGLSLRYRRTPPRTCSRTMPRAFPTSLIPNPTE